MTDADYLTMRLNDWCAQYRTAKAVWRNTALPEEIRAEAGARAKCALRSAKDTVVVRGYARERLTINGLNTKETKGHD